jgi:glycogen operon protein
VLPIVASGRSFPLGATLIDGGVNFSVYSRHATAVQLLLFDRIDDAAPSHTIDLDRHMQRTYHYWHAFVPGLIAGQLYAYRVDGPSAPELGLRFDRDKVLLDPYGRCVARPKAYSRRAAQAKGDNAASAWRSVITDASAYDWEDDVPPRRPFTKTVIYELHVGHFTRHPNSGVAPPRRGKFLGLIQKIPYLRDLGITAVELMPVFAFDEQAAPPEHRNLWGYQPISFFAPHPGYCTSGVPLATLDEFRDMVKALHRAGIEVILDVVYNHTAEGPADGPTLCLRGFANDTYYLLGKDRSTYADYSGCGNSLNANESIVRRLILDSLRYWVSEMHIDGFRFDLASVLSRDSEGRPLPVPPILWDIESDPVLANVKLIAEAWDAAGLYQVGRFVGDSWKEWNGRFRDDVRAFLKAEDRTVRALASRIVGSPDLYAAENREPEQSINFVTCHDGFTLNDLVSYDRKHNEANGEGNRDGSDENHSWNCGVEGPTDDAAIEALRNRQIKNFLALTLLAIGTPMLRMGDEVRHSQAGNNNSYCTDDESVWFDWSAIDRHADVHRFVRHLIAIRNTRDLPIERADLTLNELLAQHRVEWHGVQLGAPDWGDPSHSLAATMHFDTNGPLLHLMINSYWEPLSFAIPPLPPSEEGWHCCLDTYSPAPCDIRTWHDADPVPGSTYTVQPRSLVVLVARVNPPLQGS